MPSSAQWSGRLPGGDAWTDSYGLIRVDQTEEREVFQWSDGTYVLRWEAVGWEQDWQVKGLRREHLESHDTEARGKGVTLGN